MTFYGEDASGAHTQLIQNVGQLSVILRALSKPAKVAAPNRIGFRLAEDLAKACPPATAWVVTAPIKYSIQPRDIQIQL